MPSTQRHDLNDARSTIATTLLYAKIAQDNDDQIRLRQFLISGAVLLSVITERSKQAFEVIYAESMLDVLHDPQAAWDRLIDDDYATGTPSRAGWKSLGGYEADGCRK